MEKKSKINGTSTDAVMVIDSDDDEPALSAMDDPEEPEFEEEEGEIDPAEPISDIIGSLTIPLGAKTLALALPPCNSYVSQTSSERPPILMNTIIVAAVCSDCTTKIVTLPSTPPRPEVEMSRRRSIAGRPPGKPRLNREQILSISGASTHQEIASHVAITFTSQILWTESRRDSLPHETQEDSRRSQNHGKGSAARSRSRTEASWDLLLATCSKEASGVLLVYRIPIMEVKGRSSITYRLSSEHVFPIQRQFLRAQVTTLSFNTNVYPSERHSHLLLSTANGAVKVYACQPPLPDRSRNRRTSLLDTDETGRRSGGRWLLTLYPGFVPSPSGMPQRKCVLGAEWVLGGKAIIALCSDGEWGVWDIEGSGPGATQGLVRGQSNIQGVTGGALSTFAINGWITPSESKPATSVAKDQSRPVLAPMTPSTRKFREDRLFKNPPTPDDTPNPPVCGSGSISTLSIPGHLPDGLSKETILLTYLNSNVIIPSFESLWRTKAKSTGTFESSARSRPHIVQGLNTFGEMQLGTSLFPLPNASTYVRVFPPSVGRRPDILIVAEHRLHILTVPLNPSRKKGIQAVADPSIQTNETDQLLLTRGELDLDGMDRLLDGMQNGTGKSVDGRLSPKKKRVGFA